MDEYNNNNNNFDKIRENLESCFKNLNFDEMKYNPNENNSCYRLKKDDIPQDNININTNNHAYNDNNSEQFQNNTLKETNITFEDNIVLRNLIAGLSWILVYIMSFSFVIYCLTTPIEQINRNYFWFYIIGSWFFNYINRRFWYKEVDVCPVCGENGALYEEDEIVKNLVGTNEEKDNYEIWKVLKYECTKRLKCQFCNHYEDIKYNDEERVFVDYTELGAQRQENLRHERELQKINEERERINEDFIDRQEEVLRQNREETEAQYRQHEENQLNNQIKGNEDFFRRKEEYRKKWHRGY